MAIDPLKPGFYFGRNTLKEALSARAPISKIHVLNPSAYEFVKSLFKETKRDINSLEIEEGLPAQVKSEAHQGVAFKTSHRFYFPLTGENLAHVPHVVICNHIEDVHNLGSIARCAAAFGFGAIIHEQTKSAELTSAVMKASVGLAFRLKFFKVPTVAEILPELKSCGYRIVGLEAESKSLSLEVWDPPAKVALVLGSEGQGLEDAVKSQCHELVKIRMAPKVESLNVSHAAAIVMEKIFKPGSSV